MNQDEAGQIIEIIKNHWPSWSFEGEELRFWIFKLQDFDFIKSRLAINNFYMSYDKPGRPTAARIIRVLRATQKKQEREDSKEAILLYEIVKQGKERGFRFYSKSGSVSDKELIEKEAEIIRQRVNGLYGEGHYIVRHWEPPAPF